jgi:hypothetical protein
MNAPAALGAGRVHRREEAVGGVPLVLEAGGGALGVPLRDVVVVEHPALGVGYEDQVAPLFAHAQPAFPGGARADPAGDQRLGGGVPGEGGHDEVAVGADQVHARQLVPEGGDDAVRDGLQCVGQAACGVHVRHDLVQLPQGRKTDIRFRLGLHARPPPETSQRIMRVVFGAGRLRRHYRVVALVSPATESQRAAHSVHRVNN